MKFFESIKNESRGKERDSAHFEKFQLDRSAALNTACERGNIKSAEEMLRNYRIDLNKSRADGRTCLYVACLFGRSTITKKMLCSHLVNVNKRDKDQSTPLYVACRGNYLEIVKLMLRDARTNLSDIIHQKMNPLTISCEFRNTEVLMLFISSGRYIDDLLQSKTLSPLSRFKGMTTIEIANKKGYTEIVRLLTSFQSKPEETRQKTRELIGWPLRPLTKQEEFLYACADGQIDKIKAMLSRKRKRGCEGEK